MLRAVNHPVNSVFEICICNLSSSEIAIWLTHCILLWIQARPGHVFKLTDTSKLQGLAASNTSLTDGAFGDASIYASIFANCKFAAYAAGLPRFLRDENYIFSLIPYDDGVGG